jgi:hypothetical protein
MTASKQPSARVIERTSPPSACYGIECAKRASCQLYADVEHTEAHKTAARLIDAQGQCKRYWPVGDLARMAA